MKCEQCRKIIEGGARIQYFDPDELTTMHVFCTEECKTKWIKDRKK